MSTTSLNGRIALISGGSRGIGAAVGRRFAEAGARVALLSRSGANPDIADALCVPCDLRRRDEVAGAIKLVLSEYGGFDIVVANAGLGAYGPFLELAPADVDELIDVNIRGTLHLAQLALPTAIEKGESDFVVIGSGSGLRGLPNRAAYCASKFAQVGFVRSLMHEVRPLGVRCTLVNPGGVATDFAMGRGRTPDMPELATMMNAVDVADAVMFAVSCPRGREILEISVQPSSEPAWS